MPRRITSSRVPACLLIVLVLCTGSLVGCDSNADGASTPPMGIALSGAVTGLITSVGSCPPQAQAFASSWMVTLGGVQYTFTILVDDGHPESTYYAGAANGYGTRVTLARTGTNTMYDSTALSYEEAGRIWIRADANTTEGTLDVTLKDRASSTTVRATGRWICKA